MADTPRPLQLAARALLRKLGMHPEDPDAATFRLTGRRALCIATNHGELSPGKATGVFCSELSVPYYAFLGAGMVVDIASPAGGLIPIDPQSIKPALRCAADDRLIADKELRARLATSPAVGSLDIADYDAVYLAGGWGAAFDFAESPELGDALTQAASLGLVIGGVCHGPLGLVGATAPDGRPFVEGRRISAVTDKQVKELGIESTPFHPETELRKQGALFESATRFRDPFANHWVVDDRLVTGQNQNAGPMVAREMMRILTETGA